MEGMPMSPPSSPYPVAMGPAPPRMRMGGMHMTFFWGKDAQILFTGWPGRRHGIHTYILALLFVFALAVLEESLTCAARGIATLGRGGGGGGARAPSRSVSVAAGAVQTAVHAVRLGVAYLVMLAVMSFNGGVLLAAVAGHALGFFLLRSGAVVGRGGAYDGPAFDHTC